MPASLNTAEARRAHNAAYHADRERFFANLHRLTMFVVIVAGVAALALPGAAPWLGAAIALTGLLHVVLDVTGSARRHADRRQALLNEIDRETR